MNYLTNGNEYGNVQNHDLKLVPGADPSLSVEFVEKTLLGSKTSDRMINNEDHKEIMGNVIKGDPKVPGVDPVVESSAWRRRVSSEGMKSNGESYYFHNPFDVDSYPLTNPPLFDSTMMLTYNTGFGVPRRRRISISNGQISQITNHETGDDVDNSSYEEGTPFSAHQDAKQAVAQHESGRNAVPSVKRSESVSFVPAVPGTQQPQQPQQLVPNQHLMNSQIPPSLSPVVGVHKDVSAASASPVRQDAYSDTAGVPPPNHQLIYNDEVIFNPDNGPIPGTAAWKKERLLERNRLAASKCRQRKKHAQQQLQENINKCEEEIHEKNVKLEKAEKLIREYNVHLKQFFASGSTAGFEQLRKFVDISDINDIKDDVLG